MSDKATDGGQAFPRPASEYNSWTDGMSLRDWFAGMALQGRLANTTTYHGHADMAVECWVYADAMIAVKEVKK